jgi:hypothetical protein
MAGKTFTGIGVDDLDKLIPPVGREGAAPEAAPAPTLEDEGEDIRGVYSGPTVVDDDKVAEGLKRLRSLERTTAVGTGPGPVATGRVAAGQVAVGEVSELVADMDSSEPTKIGLPTQRPTTVGRSLSDDVPGQQMVVQPDNLRGTMFGHSVHLPDLHIPIDTDEGPSGPLYVPPKPTTTTQLVRYQQQAQPVPSAEHYPIQAQPFHRRSVFPSNEPDIRTETIPPLGRRVYSRAIGLFIGLAVIAGGGALAYRYYRAAELGAPVPQIDPPVTAAEGAGQPQPGAAPAAVGPSEPGTAAGAAAAATPPTASGEPTAAPTARPSPANDPPLPMPAKRERQAVAPAPAPEPPASADSDAAARTRRRPGHVERRRTPVAAQPATEAPPEAPAPKPAPRKKAALDEDPDATLPPSAVE